MVSDTQNTIKAFNDLISNHSGGGFFVQPTGASIDLPYITAVTRAVDFKLFTVSIYNQDTDTDSVSMTLLINPSDLTIGQTFISSDALTRGGWVSTLWGRSQPTFTTNLSTAAFYVYGIGVSSYYRKSSLSFKNFMSFIGLFRNNGYYFFKGHQNGIDNTDIFNSDPGRVINVLDQIKISYDNTDYLGSFNNLTVDETTEMPFRFSFNFEFMVSGLRGEPVDGHLKIGNNDTTSITIQTQGTYSFDEIAQLDTVSLSKIFSTNSNEADGASESNTGVSSTPANTSNYTANEKEVLADEKVKQAITDVANSLGINTQTLINIIHFESGWDAQASNKAGSSAKGLIQFTDVTAMKLGFSDSNALIAQYPDAESQLRGPVLKYLSQWKYTTNQSVYMAVFYPSARYVPPDTSFSSIVPSLNYPTFAKQNPGINTVQDYINYVEGK